MLVALVATACKQQNDGAHTPPASSPGATPPAATTAPTATTAKATRSARPSDPDPDPITHPCVVAIAQFEVALKAAPGACSAAADCACYPGGVGKLSGCGGVTDKVTANKLQTIASAYRKDGCSPTVNCAPRLCQPRCDDGKCR